MGGAHASVVFSPSGRNLWASLHRKKSITGAQFTEDSTGQDSSLKMTEDNCRGLKEGTKEGHVVAQRQWGEAAQKPVETQETRRNLGRTYCPHSWNRHLYLLPHGLQDAFSSVPYLWASLTPEAPHCATASGWPSMDHVTLYMGT